MEEIINERKLFTLRIICLLITSLAVLLASCSFQSRYSVKDDSFINSAEDGVIVISVETPFYGMAKPKPKFHVRNMGGRPFYTILSTYSSAASSYGFGGGFVTTLRLPAGEYEIFKWDLFFNVGLAQWYKHSDWLFSIPFKVVPGKINYLGEICLDDYKFRFRNMQDRDLEIALKNYPFLKKGEVIYSPLSCKDCSQ